MFSGKELAAVFTPRRLLGLALLSALAIFNTWLLFSYRLPGNSEFWLALHESEHGLIFFALSLSLCLLFHWFIFEDLRRLVLVTILLCVIFGGAVELVQSKVGRSASWSDFWLDLLGVGAGVSLYLGWQLPGVRRWGFLMLSVILIAVDLYEPYKVFEAGRQRAQAFPVIADFDTPALNYFVHSGNTGRVSYVPAPLGWPDNPTKVARLEQFPGPWPGINISEVYPDWRGYSYLVFEIYNPQEEIARIGIRVHDKHHNHQYRDRYNRSLRLGPGLHRIEIPMEKIQGGPKERENDLANIRGIIIYSYKLETQRTLYIDNIHLR